MYYPQQEGPSEPSGCFQTLVISRMIIGILLVPIMLIGGAIIAVLVGFYLLSIHPLFALLFILAAAAAMIGVARWEGRRIAKERPPDDR